MWEQWGLQSPLGAAELYKEGSCCWRCFALTTLAILGHFPVSPDQHQVSGDEPNANIKRALEVIRCALAEELLVQLMNCHALDLCAWIWAKRWLLLIKPVRLSTLLIYFLDLRIRSKHVQLTSSKSYQYVNLLRLLLLFSPSSARAERTSLSNWQLPSFVYLYCVLISQVQVLVLVLTLTSSYISRHWSRFCNIWGLKSKDENSQNIIRELLHKQRAVSSKHFSFFSCYIQAQNAEWALFFLYPGPR